MKPHPSIRIFKNPILESLTHVHPSMPFLIWIPVVAFQIYLSLFQDQLALIGFGGYFVGGVAFWTFTEYFMHRFAFHYEANTRAGKYLAWLFHGIHHDDPVDPTRLVFPPVVSIVLGYLFFLLFKWVLGPVNTRPFFSGFMSGYLAYDYIHFAVHHFRPQTRLGRAIKDNHMKHHFLKKGGKWGVSSPLWDHVFRTFNRE